MGKLELQVLRIIKKLNNVYCRVLKLESNSSINIKTVSSNTSLDYTATQWNVDTDSGNINVQLPLGVDNTEYKIVNTGSSGNVVNVTPNGTDLLLGENNSFSLSDSESLIIGYITTNGWY